MFEVWAAWLDELTSDDTPHRGGKNASLGEMISRLSSRGVRVPTGFAATAAAYWAFLDANSLRQRIAEQITELHNGTGAAKAGWSRK